MNNLDSPNMQLDEISEDSEKLPPTVKLTLLQTAVRSINDLRIVETLDELVPVQKLAVAAELRYCSTNGPPH